MIDDIYDPQLPEFLASRALDEQPTAEEQAALDRALATTPGLRTSVEQMRQVSDWVARWGAASREIDWETHARLIDMEVAGEADTSELQGIDRLVSGWGRRRIEFEDEAFAASVLKRIGSKRPRRSLSRILLSVGTPLAAAAVIVLAVSLRSLPTGVADPVTVVSIGPHCGMFEGVPVSPVAPRTIVSFARVETPESVSDERRLSFRFVSIEVSPRAEDIEGTSPL